MNKCIAVTIGLLFISAIAGKSHAVDRQWLGAIDQSWTNPGNWFGSSIPTTGDTAIFGMEDEQMIRIDSSVSIGSMVVAGSKTSAIGHTFIGDGLMTMDGLESTIWADGAQFDVPIELQNNTRFFAAWNDADPIVFTKDITIGSHVLQIRGPVIFADLTIRGSGSIDVQNGTLTASGTFEGDASTGPSFIAPAPTLVIQGNADISVEMDIFDETRFDTVDGGGVGTLEVARLRVQMGQFPNADLIGQEFQVFDGWESITVSELELPVIGEWDTSRLHEGILKVADVNAPRCDLNLSGVCDIVDLDILGDVVRNDTNDLRADVNEDGLVNLQDRDEWLVLAGLNAGYRSGFLSGDTDLDGTVNAADLMQLGLNWQRTDATRWRQADFNMDGAVNSSDLNDIGRNWLKALEPAVNPLPEPAAYLSLMLGGILFFNWLRHSRTILLGLLLMIGTWLS